MFDALYHRKRIVKWINNWFQNESGNARKIIIGMSGGKDSTICAALCVEAIGANHVIGVLMPNGVQRDFDDAIAACEAVGIRYVYANIGMITENLTNIIEDALSSEISAHTKTNIPPRIRMAVLYAIAQELHGRVCGTGNACERYVGYCTKGGDLVCDFAPIANYTVDEVYAIGETFENLPIELVRKTPEDGLSGKTDEENLGVTYSMIGQVMRDPLARQWDKDKQAQRVQTLHSYNKHKIIPIPTCPIKDRR